MTIGAVPTRQPLPVTANLATWPEVWRNWFTGVINALVGWRATLTASLTHDFGNILAHAQATTTVTVTGAVAGDAVHVTSGTPTSGILVDGYVSANDTVTIRAHNYTGGAIDPASSTFRVIVFQQ